MGLGGPSAGTLHVAGDIPHVREHPLPTGDTRLPPGTLSFHWGHPALRRQESCPRRRRMPPAGVSGARSRRMSPAGVSGARSRRMSPASSNASGGVGRPCGLCRPRSRTYFSVGDCVLPREVTTGPQSFGEEVRPGRRTQSPMFQDGSAAPSSRLVRAGHERVGPPCRYGGAPPGGPGLPRGAVVGTDQGRSGTAAITSWRSPPPAAEPASTARTGRHDFPGASPPQGRVLAARDGLACRSRGTPA